MSFQQINSPYNNYNKHIKSIFSSPFGDFTSNKKRNSVYTTTRRITETELRRKRFLKVKNIRRIL